MSLKKKAAPDSHVLRAAGTTQRLPYHRPWHSSTAFRKILPIRDRRAPLPPAPARPPAPTPARRSAALSDGTGLALLVVLLALQGNQLAAHERAASWRLADGWVHQIIEAGHMQGAAA
jgi:hypothetical protein